MLGFVAIWHHAADKMLQYYRDCIKLHKEEAEKLQKKEGGSAESIASSASGLKPEDCSVWPEEG